MKEKKIFLTIAGSDPCGGAGIQTDIRTADSIGLYPCTVITTLTAQNSSKVEDVWSVEADKIKAQLDCLLDDIRPDAVKIGLIRSIDTIQVIEEAIQKFDLHNIVIDPISGLTLANKEPDYTFAKAYLELLFPIATIVTPNIPEKEYFEKAAGKRFETFCNAFLLKGGHGESSEISDILYYHALSNITSAFQSSAFPTINNRTQPFLPQDGSPFGDKDLTDELLIKEFNHKRVKTENTHGSGCVLSSAIACFLALDYHLEKAVEAALKFTYNALKKSASVRLGKGTYGPTLY